ncbi:hypothetical protein BDW42DRAFT_174641 [Aspergillus taichungensis]|uniref:Uncharacterized protein n=1 Tax=Aspergillus taichungensis TaxID=482145 RepID=A0A2J5HN74_9EURO|nr:hypothetical protein BDW42DRAFT_174641 [Aspergillus taichungensis]
MVWKGDLRRLGQVRDKDGESSTVEGCSMETWRLEREMFIPIWWWPSTWRTRWMIITDWLKKDGRLDMGPLLGFPFSLVLRFIGFYIFFGVIHLIGLASKDG